MNNQKDNTLLFPDDMIETIMLNARYEEITALCGVNNNYHKICDTIWKKLIERDFPFMFESKCKLKKTNRYNTYKKIYEIVHYIISRGVYNILDTYEKQKKMKNRYPSSIYDQLFNLMTSTISQYMIDYIPIDYKQLMENIAILLSTKYNATGLKFMLDTRVFDYIKYFNCEDIQYVNLDKIFY